MRNLLLAGAAITGLALTTPAGATLIASFSQNPSATPTVNATDNGTTTTITVNSASTTISAGAIVNPNAFFSLTATSVDPVTQIPPLIIQHYSGNFCFSSLAGCGGTNLLSGVFTDAAFGQGGGPGLTVNVNNPPDTLTLTSGVLPASALGPPSTFNLTFADLLPLLHVDGATIAAFAADFSGTISSSVPEPISLALLGVGLLGLGVVRSRGRSL